MTFLTLSETSVCGRTCHEWLHVAYHVTPNKNSLFQFAKAEEEWTIEKLGDDVATARRSNKEKSLKQVQRMIESPWKRHFNRFHLYVFDVNDLPDENEMFERLCSGIKEMKWLVIENKGSYPQLEWRLAPLLQHSDTLTRLTFKGLELQTTHFLIIRQLSQLFQLQYLTESGAPVSWSLGDLHLITSNSHFNQLKNFEFRLSGPLSIEHIECLKKFPLDAITRLVPKRGILMESVRDLSYFTGLKLLLFPFPHVHDQDIVEVLSVVLKNLSQLRTLGLSRWRCRSGELTTLLQHQPQLASIAFDEVTFESPECLKELVTLNLPLTRLTFTRCDTVRFDHLLQCGSLTSLRVITHSGRNLPSEQILTREEQLALTPPNSTAMPFLKQFNYNWIEETDG